MDWETPSRVADAGVASYNGGGSVSALLSRSDWLAMVEAKDKAKE
jgi:hypothetical protein